MNYTDLPRITLEQVQHFFEHYKDLKPSKFVRMQDWRDAAESKQLIRQAIARAQIFQAAYGRGRCVARCARVHLPLDP